MPQINPYIRFNGNAAEAFDFYKSVFGGQFSKLIKYKEFSSPKFSLPEADADSIMHVSLPVGNSGMLMGSDTLSIMGKVNETDNRNAISITADSRNEADTLFSSLSQGGNIEMPIADGPLGFYFGMLTDQYGVEWMIQHDPRQ